MRGCWPICRTPKEQRAWGLAPTAEGKPEKGRRSSQDRLAALLKRMSGNGSSGLHFLSTNDGAREIVRGLLCGREARPTLLTCFVGRPKIHLP
jgi:hypothetical protein